MCMNCNWGKYLNGGICPHKGRQEGFVLRKKRDRDGEIVT